MPKIILSCLFICLQLVSNSQVTSLLHPFILSDDIESISAPLKVRELSVPEADVILTRTNFSCFNTCGILPVQLLSFDAERKSDSVVKVTWKTTNELNNKEFVIQRSLGKTGPFTNTGRLMADYLPAVTHHYAFLDGNDYENISYYRLQQIDINNEFSYSRIVAVKGYSRFESLSVYPNPATTGVMLEIKLKKMDKIIIDIYNSEGQRINEQTLFFKKGNNVLNINVSQYGKGIYFIKGAKSDGRILDTKFIKQ